MEQTSIPLSAETELDRKFREYHEATPALYTALERLAQEAVNRGRNRIGFPMLWEVVRWNTTIRGNDEFKLNNNYRSRYARLLLNNHPEWGDLFEIREMKKL